MSPKKNDRFLRAIYHEPIDATPVWIMRQAGRYLPEYRATRQKAGSFLNLCKTPELAAEVTLQPLKRFDLDAAILFSDILTIPDAMGFGLQFSEGQGPSFAKKISSPKQIHTLSPVDTGALTYTYDAIRLIQKELDNQLPLIGFSGSPWTLACYVIEGESRPGFPKAINLKNNEPALVHQLLEILSESITQHLIAQAAAGVDALMLFDTWGGLLSTNEYEIFSLHYLKQIIETLNKRTAKKIPVILFTKGGSEWITLMAETNCQVLGLDWNASLKKVRAQLSGKIALQGNLNPEVLLKSRNHIEEAVAMLLADYGCGSGHIFNLGHGITPDVPPENVAVLVDAVHALSRQYHLPAEEGNQ